MKIFFTIGNKQFTATLEENVATLALAQKLKYEPITLKMHDYGGFEKVGALGFSLPTKDEEITTKPLDVVLYQDNQIVIFYGSNTWEYTRLAKIKDITVDKLKEILGSREVSVTISLSSIPTYCLKNRKNKKVIEVTKNTEQK